MTAETPGFRLETDRLVVRPFVPDDLATIHAILNAAFGEQPIAERRAWLDWTIRNYTALARLYQPPFGDRAIVLKATQTLIGAVGLVPSYGPFETLPLFGGHASDRFTLEMGLFWALGVPFRGHGYATEAAQAVIEYAFSELNLKRIVAMTEHDNAASIAVMMRLGMIMQRNPHATPEWFQTVGILRNPNE
jgi:RimJ/RimL family protein N-acetyltransferase